MSGGFPVGLGAEFSEERVHRYLLWRVWSAEKPPLGFVMLNPSSADEKRDDATTVRNMRRARVLGYGGVVQANLYSYRTPSPKALFAAGAPGFVLNDDGNLRAWARVAEACDDVVLAWGAHADVQHAKLAVGFLASCAKPLRLLHLGRLKDGAPRHPLHTAYAAPLQEWD